MGCPQSNNNEANPRSLKKKTLNEPSIYLEKVFHLKYSLTIYKSDHLSFYHNGIVVPINDRHIHCDSMLHYLHRGEKPEFRDTIRIFREEYYKATFQVGNLLIPPPEDTEDQKEIRNSLQPKASNFASSNSIQVVHCKSSYRTTISENTNDSLRIFFVRYPTYSGKKSDIPKLEFFFTSLLEKVKTENVTHLCCPQTTGL